MKTKIISIILTIAVLFSLTQTVGFAQENTASVAVNSVEVSDDPVTPPETVEEQDIIKELESWLEDFDLSNYYFSLVREMMRNFDNPIMFFYYAFLSRMVLLVASIGSIFYPPFILEIREILMNQ